MSAAPQQPDHAALQAEVEQLKTALESRTVIGQATGMIMERHKTDADQAFRTLVRWSQEQNRKLRDLAAEMTASIASPEPEG